MANRDYNIDIDEGRREFRDSGELYPDYDWLAALEAAVRRASHSGTMTVPEAAALILAASYLMAKDPENMPDWVGIIAGGNPDYALDVIDIVFELGELEG